MGHKCFQQQRADFRLIRRGKTLEILHFKIKNSTHQEKFKMNQNKRSFEQKLILIEVTIESLIYANFVGLY